MLVSSIDDVRKYAAVSVDLDFISIEPSIRKADRRFIIPLLGIDFYTELKINYESRSLNAAQSALLDQIRSCSVPLALWYYVQVGGVQIDNSGIYITRNDQRWNLGDKERETLQSAYLYEGLEALDDLMNFLAYRIEDFPEYAETKEYKSERNSLVPSATLIQEIFSMLYPRVTFRAMREGIRTNETNRVAPLMQDYYQILVDKKETELDNDDKALLPLAQRAIIYLATARAIITRTVKLTSEGLKVIVGENGSVTPSENSRIEAAAKEYEKSGEAEMQRLVKLLNKLKPSGYTAPLAEPAPTNYEDNTGIILF